jgi:RluA family pseudouridine synthase
MKVRVSLLKGCLFAFPFPSTLSVTMKFSRRLPNILPEILFEDDDLVILNKPSGLLVLPDRYDPTIPNLQVLLRETYGQIFVVHRIDKETSGLVVFARKSEAHRALSIQFEDRKTEKVYQAICTGDAGDDEGRINLPISEDLRMKGKMKIDSREGKESVTRYRVVERFNAYAHVEAKPETGRTHQIRIHLSSIGLPILGDRKYGGGEGLFLSAIKPGYRVRGEEKPLLSRTALHAASIAFAHPATYERVTFEAPLPKDMRIALTYLRKFRPREGGI